MSDAARALAAYGRRTYTRLHPLDAARLLRWQILAIRAEGAWLYIKPRATDLAGSKVLLDPERDARLGFDEIVIGKPGTFVDDGEEPNPDFNALIVGSEPTRRKRRHDPVERLKQELDRKLIERERLDA